VVRITAVLQPMSSPTEVLITFYCRTGDTELLALAAAVGAVQARANIRLRRLPDSIPVTPDSDNALTRMCKEYVLPTEADVLRADAIIFAAPAGFTPAAPEWSEYLGLLSRLGADGKLSGKIAVALGEDAKTATLLSTTIAQAGFTLPSISGDATAQGRQIANHARILKQAQSER
jgi:hypothetical protein